MKTILAACCAFGLTMAAAATPASALGVTFNTTGNTPDNGSYGNALYFPAATPGSALQLKVTGWQSNKTTNAITSAYVGAYGPGLGVTGLGDYSGSYGYHQIDNSGSYTDFVLLQFSAPVVLSGLTLNDFTLGSSATKDSDLAVYAAAIPEGTWNASLPLTSYTTVPSLWTTVPGTGTSGTVATGMTTASKEWLVGAAFNSGGNDGFKISSITVTSPVPEPATWAMMIAGIGVVGGTMRRPRRAGRMARATA